MGGIVHCHAAEKEEATRDGAVGKEKNLGGEKNDSNRGMGVWISVLSSLVNLSRTNLGSGSS